MKYPYNINGEVTTIFITRKDGTTYEVFIDTEDLLKMSAISSMYVLWQIGDIPRVAIRVGSGKNQIRSYLHRYIINAPEDKLVDHYNNNPLDNRKSNLRLADMSENMQNRRGATYRSKSGVRGVYWDTEKKLWVASINVNKIKVFFKRYRRREEAEAAVIAARAKYMPFSQEALEAAKQEERKAA